MIYLDIMGRCGNQLFQYAFARTLMEKSNDHHLTINTYELSNPLNKGSFWENSLLYFNTSNYVSTSVSTPSILLYGSKFQKTLFRLRCLINLLITNKDSKLYIYLDSFLFWFLSKYGIYYFRQGFSNYRLTKYSNSFICGYFEDERWFNDNSFIIKQEFAVKNSFITNPIKDFILQTSTSDSVCISLRKWDIDVSSSDELTLRSVCNSSYYKAAISYMLEHLTNPVFFVFSDDVNWAKIFLSECNNDISIICEPSNCNIGQKMLLMRNCKNFIMSNSTFCWWAEYLSNNAPRIVISPSTWTLGKKDTHLIRDGWIGI